MNENMKRLIIVGVFIISVIIILFGGALIYNKFFYSKTYSEVENIMLDAAKSYFTKYEEKLPKNVNDSITVSDATLVKNGDMNSISSYIKNNESCTGEVTITNINDDYRYTPILDCGSKYQTKTLTDYIDEFVDIVTSGNGLYELNGELVYRGDDVDNYLRLNDKRYRIVKFTDGHPVIIFTEIPESTQWDNRYNITVDNNSGINNYDVSRIRDYLDDLYNANGKDALLSDESRLLVASYDLPIGKRGKKDTDMTGSLENAITLTNQYIGLLPVNDFLNASIDKDCTSTTSKSCSNYNYLNKYKYSWWTSTAYNEDTYSVYTIKNMVNLNKASSSAHVRPVLYLVKDAIYVSGDGSKANPYIVK